jgi:glycerol-3-phosphate dehydrogenase
MIRNPDDVGQHAFDVLVVGAGIHGAMVAWDAALRGLRVGLVEKGDFGGGTSQNSLKVIHGGLRYLPDLSLRRFRLMARERSTWLRIAPHLVHPLPFVTPTYSRLARSRLAMRVGLKLNDVLSADRNLRLDPGRNISEGRIISKQELYHLLPGLEFESASGGAVWYDAQMYSSERLLLEVVLSAAEAGARISNYLEAVALLFQGNTVTGVRARDELTGSEFDIQSRLVVNCAGAWIDHLLETLGPEKTSPKFSPSVAINLIVDQVWERFAVGLPDRDSSEDSRSKMIFIVPWRNKSIIGTWHAAWPHPAEDFILHENLIQDFINGVNSAHPALRLGLDDIHCVHYGFLPAEETEGEGARVKLTREAVIVDHKTEDDLDGLLSVVGVKYTTARAAAEEAIDRAVIKLGLDKHPSRTASTPLYGGDIPDFNRFLAAAHSEASDCLPPDVIDHLAHTYGTSYRKLLTLIRQEPALGEKLDGTLPVTRAEVVFAVRQEMAQTLQDIVFRRTELGALGLPTIAALERCADIAAEELDWDKTRRSEEVNQVIEKHALRHFKAASPV